MLSPAPSLLVCSCWLIYFAHINRLFSSYKLLFLSIKKLAFINRWRLEFSSDECSCRHAPYCIFVIHEQSTDRGVDIDKVRINGCRNDCDDCRWYDIIAGGFLGIGRFWTAISTSQDDEWLPLQTKAFALRRKRGTPNAGEMWQMRTKLRNR